MPEDSSRMAQAGHHAAWDKSRAGALVPRWELAAHEVAGCLGGEIGGPPRWLARPPLPHTRKVSKPRRQESLGSRSHDRFRQVDLHEQDLSLRPVDGIYWYSRS